MKTVPLSLVALSVSLGLTFGQTASADYFDWDATPEAASGSVAGVGVAGTGHYNPDNANVDNVEPGIYFIFKQKVNINLDDNSSIIMRLDAEAVVNPTNANLSEINVKFVPFAYAKLRRHTEFEIRSGTTLFEKNLNSNQMWSVSAHAVGLGGKITKNLQEAGCESCRAITVFAEGAIDLLGYQLVDVLDTASKNLFRVGRIEAAAGFGVELSNQLTLKVYAQGAASLSLDPNEWVYFSKGYRHWNTIGNDNADGVVELKFGDSINVFSKIGGQWMCNDARVNNDPKWLTGCKEGVHAVTGASISF